MPIEFNCPECQNRLRVPDETAGGEASCPSCHAVVMVPAGETDTWRVLSPSGEEYGPVTKTELDQWATEGRLTAEFRVKSEGSDAWQPAAQVCPAVLGETTVSGQSSAASEGCPTPSGLKVEEHRGGLVLTLAILGLVCTCFPLGIAAWVMAANDLAAMRAGRMDKAGESVTRVGMIIGILGVALFVLSMVNGMGIRWITG